MATKRLNAYNDVLNRTPKSVELDGKLSDLFGTLVFQPFGGAIRKNS